jgi:uncharacterized membrane protein
MKDYSYAEIGMLAGAAIGGGIAFILCSMTSSIWSYIITAIGITAGIYCGRALDRKGKRGENRDTFIDF